MSFQQALYVRITTQVAERIEEEVSLLLTGREPAGLVSEFQEQELIPALRDSIDQEYDVFDYVATLTERLHALFCQLHEGTGQSPRRLDFNRGRSQEYKAVRELSHSLRQFLVQQSHPSSLA